MSAPLSRATVGIAASVVQQARRILVIRRREVYAGNKGITATGSAWSQHLRIFRHRGLSVLS